jgi:hypothetical protein
LPFIEPASGAAEAQRWAAKEKRPHPRGCVIARPVVSASTTMVHINPKRSVGQRCIAYGGQQPEAQRRTDPI